MTDTFLSIVIPTYLRAGSSVLNHQQFLDEAASLGVAIYLSDDSPDDSIEQLFEAVEQHLTSAKDPPINNISCWYFA